jgi:hypothetical protein
VNQLDSIISEKISRKSQKSGPKRSQKSSKKGRALTPRKSNLSKRRLTKQKPKLNNNDQNTVLKEGETWNLISPESQAQKSAKNGEIEENYNFTENHAQRNLRKKKSVRKVSENSYVNFGRSRSSKK